MGRFEQALCLYSNVVGPRCVARALSFLVPFLQKLICQFWMKITASQFLDETLYFVLEVQHGCSSSLGRASAR